MVLPEYELEANWFHKINGVSTVFIISRCFHSRKTPKSEGTVLLPYPRNPIRRYCYVHY